MEAGETQQVSWNLSQSIIMEIGNLLQRANTYYLSGHLDQWFFSLKAIKMRFIQSLEPKEREELAELELNIISMGSFKLAMIQVENYNERIMDLLQRYGYAMKLRDDLTNINN